MKKKLLFSAFILLILCIGAVSWVVFFWQPGPSYKSVAYLENPEIISLPDETMMAVTLSGNPSTMAGEGVNVLYASWTTVGGQWGSDVAVRSRWEDPEEFGGSEDGLTATFGLPLPEGVTELPVGIDERLEVETWQYGTVAQILHVGSYDSEKESIDVLRQFIADQGYVISGEHEEVYLKGPNMFGFGNEENFLTIIRYQVEPRGEGL